MIFVTTGQKIAVENFSKGAIYKVTFTDESISYMMCVGIGKDFVMLQSTDPLLFSLTIQSASRVSTIDVHDPTPPEPPTPIENALQYQTGEPPFTFTTTENSLFSWYIEGEAGVKTANLLNVTSDTSVFLNLGSGSGYAWTINADKTITNPEGKAFYGGFRIKVEPNTTYTCHCVASYNGQMRLAEYSDIITDLTTNRIKTTINVTIKQPGQGYGTVSFTTTAETKWVLFYWYIDGSYSPNTLSDLMFLEGEYDRYTIPDYIPYGYKISISTNEHTTTIYLDEPIAEGEKLYSVNVDAQIVTDIGENTLSVSDPQPPEMQIVYGIYAEA